MSLSISHFSYQMIGQAANKFLASYHQSFSLPIPIEEIAEQKLNLKIVERLRLKKDYDVEGFLTSDLKSIFIDLDIYLKFEKRSRFTIAHEIGHLVLHSDIFKNLNINSVETLNSFSAKITNEEYGWLEFQAYSFAGHVLVPTESLRKELKKMLRREPHNETLENIFPISQDLLNTFGVSGEVLLKRLEKEGFVKRNG